MSKLITSVGSIELAKYNSDIVFEKALGIAFCISGIGCFILGLFVFGYGLILIIGLGKT